MQQQVTIEPKQKYGNGVRPVPWSIDLEACAKEYYAFTKETENCPEMGDNIDVSNALKRYAKFMMLQNRHPDVLLVPPFDVKVVWLAHMIRVQKYRADCTSSFGRVIDCHVLESNFRSQASLPNTQQLWKNAYGSQLVFEYQPGLRRVNIPETVLDNKPFVMTITPKDVIMDRKWISDLDNVNRGFSFNDTFVRNARMAYEMYMYMLVQRKDCPFGPPVTVDLIWHAHMCNPLRYEKDCFRVGLGRIVLHSPWPEEGGTTEEVENIFDTEFGTSMLEISLGMAAVCSDPPVAAPKAAGSVTPGGPTPAPAPAPAAAPVAKRMYGRARLVVLAGQANNLVAKDSNGFSDPYLAITPHVGNRDHQKHKTKTLKKTLNPEWNEKFTWEFPSRPYAPGDYLLVQCWDENLIGADFEGEVRIPLDDLAFDHSVEKSYLLAPRQGKRDAVGGSVHLRIAFEAVRDRRVKMCKIANPNPNRARKCDITVSPRKPRSVEEMCMIARAPPPPIMEKCEIQVDPVIDVDCDIAVEPPVPQKPTPAPIPVMCSVMAPDIAIAPPPCFVTCEPPVVSTPIPAVPLDVDCFISLPSPAIEPEPPMRCKIERDYSPVKEIPAKPQPSAKLEAEIARCVCANICTFSASLRAYPKQTFYRCTTCGYTDNQGLCESCYNKCHKNHTVSKHVGECYCDCGAAEAPGVKCSAMPNTPAAAPPEPFIEPPLMK